MTEKHRHLPLPKHVDFTRKKRRGGFGYEKADRNREGFYQAETRKLDSIGEAYKKDREKHRRYFEPSLIFKIKLAGNRMSDESFRGELRRAGIGTSPPRPAGLGYWVAFTDDAEFKKFRRKLSKWRSEDKATFIDLIDDIVEIPVEEKLGRSLKENPLVEGKPEHLDVEIWRMEDDRLAKFMPGLLRLVEENRGRIFDRLVTGSFCVLRIKCDDTLLSKITELRETSHVDRPPRPDIESGLDAGIGDFEIGSPPDKDKPGILIVDSGIRGHPLLEGAIADQNILLSRAEKAEKKSSVDDDTGHGTAVAGIALYGDVRKCMETGTFDPQIWLYSAKVLHRGPDGEATYGDESLLEHQLQDAVERMVERHPACKIVNVSLGNPDRQMTSGQRQFRIASLIDELSYRHPDILFTISAGNNTHDRKSYPRYLMGHTPSVKIIDPATSVHGITVGSIFTNPERPENPDHPSHFTCVGPGLRGMVKPELVDYGGDSGSDVVIMNSNWIEGGRLFALEWGTSLSAPKIAHRLAKLKDAFPDASRNLLKALLLSSATVPPDRPAPLDRINPCGTNKDLQKILDIYGYGKPDLDRALHSESNRVLLTHDGKIGLNRVELFTINIPGEFLKKTGRRTIEVTLTFDPPANGNRADYMGVTMEHHLFMDSPVKNIRELYERIEIGGRDDNITPTGIRNKEIKMLPGVNLRKRGAHQKSTREYRRKPNIDAAEPLVLAVACLKKWFDEKGYRQPYSVIVAFRHDQEIDLYNMIRLRNRVRGRV